MPTSRQRRSLALLAAGAALTFGVTGGLDASAAPGSSGRNPNTDAVAQTGVDSSSAVVALSREPLATDPRTAPGKGKKIDFTSTAVKSERALLVDQRNTFKQWLKSNAPSAKVTGEYDVALNAVAVRLNGTALSTLRSGPGVTSVGYQGSYSPTADDPDLPLIDAMAGWAAAGNSAAGVKGGGAANAGHGIKVGVVDTGIDVKHPCFGQAGFPATAQIGNPAYTNNKVIVARVFANKAASLGYDAKAVQDHGTHVAGTIACDAHTPASIDGVDITYDPSGVAPGAQLGSYNVFPGNITDARSEDILDALQAAAEDGMDVINMSLGGNAHGNQDLLTVAVDNLDRAGIVVAVSAGNDGPGHYTVGSPGSAERALTAGASSVGHFISVPVTSGTSRFETAAGDFTTPATPLTGTLVAAKPTAAGNLGLGCIAGSYPASVAGNIALVSRGDCTFGNKVAVAEAQKAAAVIVVNNVAGDPTAMAADEAFPTKLPAVMAGLADKAALTGIATASGAATIGTDKRYVQTRNSDIMAGFSSQGPTDVDFRVKPDVVAPGVNVLSSIPGSFCDAGTNPDGCWAFFSGTSMASPHLAGTAAVVRQAHPGWDASQVRSAITNTAKQGVLDNYKVLGQEETDPVVIGAGLDDVDAAVTAQVALSSVSTSFGAVPSGSGKALSRTLTRTSLTGAAQTLAVSVKGDDAFSASPSTVVVPAQGSVTLTVSYSPTKAVAKGDHSATLDLGGVAHAVLYAFAK